MCPEKTSREEILQCNSKNQRKPSQPEELLQQPDIILEIYPIGKKHGIEEIILIGTKDIAVAEWVRLKCKYGCKNYGKSWCCPPETPAPEQTKALINEYDKALLLCGSIRNTHFYKDNHQKRRKQVYLWKATVAVERKLFLSGYYKAFAMVSESCALCKECLYPKECKFPTDRRPSIESLSIDVFQTLKNIGKKFKLAGDITDEYNCYSIILLE